MEAIPLLAAFLLWLVVFIPGMLAALRKNRRAPGTGEKTYVWLARFSAILFGLVFLYALVLMLTQFPNEPPPEQETISITLEDIRDRLPG